MNCMASRSPPHQFTEFDFLLSSAGNFALVLAASVIHTQVLVLVFCPDYHCLFSHLSWLYLRTNNHLLTQQ